MYKKDKTWIILAIYGFVAFIVFFIHYVGIIFIDYGDKYNLYTIPINNAFGIIAGIIGIDLLLSIPLSVVVMVIIFIGGKLKNKLNWNEEDWEKVWIPCVIYGLVLFFVYFIHYILVFFVDYSDYGYYSIPLKITYGVITSIIGFDLLLSIPITVVILVLIYYLDKK